MARFSVPNALSPNRASLGGSVSRTSTMKRATSFAVSSVDTVLRPLPQSRGGTLHFSWKYLSISSRFSEEPSQISKLIG